jgi:hypothetical protein
VLENTNNAFIGQYGFLLYKLITNIDKLRMNFRNFIAPVVAKAGNLQLPGVFNVT